MTDYDIHVNDSTEVVKDIETIKALVNNLIQNQLIEADTAVEAIDTKSMTELKHSVKSSIKRQKEEMGQVSQLTQQLE